MVSLETGIILFVLGGIGTVATFTAFKVADELGSELKLAELLPALPHEGAPIPKFMITRPELLGQVFKGG